MKELSNYIEDPKNPNYNFTLGKWYEDNGYIAPAVSFYLRCSDFTEDIELRYESLLRVFCCYNKAGNRSNTCETTLKQAIALYPTRIEAYFLLAKFYKEQEIYIDCYTYSSIALEFLPNQTNFIQNIDYPGYYALYFLKACSCWYVGKPEDSRRLYMYIFKNMLDDLDKPHKDILSTSMRKLGTGKPSVAIRKYEKNKHKLKHKFNGSEKVEHNFSQAYQDICALTLFDGKKNGTYLEIGASYAFITSNTALLEQFDWKGIGIEYQQDLANTHLNVRKNLVLCENALECDYEEILSKISPDSNIIDYLQVDIEPSRNTFMALVILPFHKWKFRFITFEHDGYIDITKSFKQKSRDFLHSLGYKLLINDVAPYGDYYFEDWWYHPDLVDNERVDLIKHVDLDKIHTIEEIFLNK